MQDTDSNNELYFNIKLLMEIKLELKMHNG